VNACIAPLVSIDGKHVITVEGIGNVKDPHAIQQRIAVGNGSQCGFCTPGIVMVRPCDYFFEFVVPLGIFSGLIFPVSLCAAAK